MKKDFLTLDDIRREEIFDIFKIAEKLKKRPYNNWLQNKNFILLFFKHSTRTRASFQIGIEQMGGKAYFVDGKKTQLVRGETPEDMANTLERYTDGMIIRLSSHKTLERIAKALDKPVINALSDLAHPCQILSDLFTIKEKFGSFSGLKLTYVGDGNNVCNSLLLGCSKVGMDISVACSKGFEPNKDIVKLAKDYTKITKSKVIVETEPKSAVKDANIIYNDTFISMGDEKEKPKRLKIFIPKYQVTNKLFKLAVPNAVYMHCLPAHRGEEVTAEVIDGPRSIVFDQAENRLHTQKALLTKMMVPKYKLLINTRL